MGKLLILMLSLQLLSINHRVPLCQEPKTLSIIRSPLLAVEGLCARTPTTGAEEAEAGSGHLGEHCQAAVVVEGDCRATTPTSPAGAHEDAFLQRAHWTGPVPSYLFARRAIR